MADEPINLNKARKARARAALQKAAAENRVRFGRTKEEKSAEEAIRKKTAKVLDLHRREDSGET
jgi:hypothetical protein